VAEKTLSLPTRWTSDVLSAKTPLQQYPRPQMKRPKWICLNGMWNYAIADGEQPPAK